MKIGFQPAPYSLKNTFCVFQEVPVETVDGLILNYWSKSGSSYFYTEQGMYRLSNHWGRLANCKWRLEMLEPKTLSKLKLGFAVWSSFYPDNTTDKLYFLAVNYDLKTVQYQHKNCSLYDQKMMLRTSVETTKRIKQVRNILTLNSWAKYCDYEDLDKARYAIVELLVHTDLPLEQIKKMTGVIK